jgi:peptidoglycan/LPS O-acetylase OafA/YrhL
MKHISDYVSGRDNNFNLIRFLAAGTVVFAHSFIVVTGDRFAGPLVAATGHDLGYHAVNVFFVASGFLIALSWRKTPSLPTFLSARLLRLWPALILCAVVVTFLIGPLLTSLPAGEYLRAAGTWKYLPKVVDLLGADSALPGVATTVPGDGGIDAPLWTLKYEVICYLCLAAFGLMGGFSTPRRFCSLMVPVLMLLALASLTPVAHDATRPYDHLIRFGLCFGFGVVAFFAARRVPLSLWGVVAAFALAVLLRRTAAYEFVLCFFTAYATVWAALVPAGTVRNFNRLGDYSYGIYIYAYPIQQLLVQRLPRLTPLALFVAAAPLAIALAVASWHWLERPCLARKRELAAYVEGLRRVRSNL